jgi:hypothetical protein
MKRVIIVLVAVAAAAIAAVAFWRRRQVVDLWDEARNTVSSRGDVAGGKAGEVVDSVSGSVAKAAGTTSDALCDAVGGTEGADNT